jgi:hypothetical protein
MGQGRYNERDYAIMANNVFHQLCGMGGEWHDIAALADKVGAFNNNIDVAYLVEDILVERQFIERDPHTNNVRLTTLGRQNCDREGIDIPPSDIQRLRRRLGI